MPIVQSLILRRCVAVALALAVGSGPGTIRPVSASAPEYCFVAARCGQEALASRLFSFDGFRRAFTGWPHLRAHQLVSIGMAALVFTSSLGFQNHLQSQSRLDPQTLRDLQNFSAQVYTVPNSAWIEPMRKSIQPVPIEPFELVSDVDSSMETVIMQAADGPGALSVGPLLQTLRPDIQIIVLVQNANAANLVWRSLGTANFPNLAHRLRFALIQTDFSSWGRDPYVVLVDPKDGRYTMIPAKGDSGTRQSSGVAPLLMQLDVPGNQWVPNSFAVASPAASSTLRTIRSFNYTWDLQGGDVRSDSRFVYVGQSSVHYSQYNSASALVRTKAEVIRQIRQMTKREPLILDGPDIHEDRYHSPLGRTPFGAYTSLLADPVLALEAIAAMSPQEKERATDRIFEVLTGLKGGQDGQGKEITRAEIHKFFFVTKSQINQARNSREEQKLNNVRRTLEAKGITVRPIPGIPKGFAGSPIGFYYTNSLMDRFSDASGKPHRAAILPRYDVPVLDLMAQRIYAEAGFDEIKTMGSVYLGFAEGGPRCLVQVLAKPFHSGKTAMLTPAAPVMPNPRMPAWTPVWDAVRRRRSRQQPQAQLLHRSS